MWLHSCLKCSAAHNSPACNIKMAPNLASESIKWKPYCTAVVLLSGHISSSPLCPCNYFGEHICFNMSLVNEPGQGMLQASSSWLTCIWHYVPFADRCRVAVCSSGLCHCTGSDMIGAVEELTAGIMKVSLGAVGKDLSFYKMWSSQHICLLGYRVHIMFCSFNFLMCIIFHC